MKPNNTPNGFVAKCQCGLYVGALDVARTPNQEASRLLGKWLFSGCTVEPRFGIWMQDISACQCKQPKRTK